MSNPCGFLCRSAKIKLAAHSEVRFSVGIVIDVEEGGGGGGTAAVSSVSPYRVGDTKEEVLGALTTTSVDALPVGAAYDAHSERGGDGVVDDRVGAAFRRVAAPWGAT